MSDYQGEYPNAKRPRITEKTLTDDFFLKGYKKYTDEYDPGVYCIPCGTCNANYIGETKRSHMTRMKEHRRDLNSHDPQKSALAKHCIENRHIPDFSAIKFLARVPNYFDRLLAESFYIHTSKKVVNDKLSNLCALPYLSGHTHNQEKHFVKG